jgi:hypothetical protein
MLHPFILLQFVLIDDVLVVADDGLDLELTLHVFFLSF